jgi:hypothetical protein
VLLSGTALIFIVVVKEEVTLALRSSRRLIIKFLYRNKSRALHYDDASTSITTMFPHRAKIESSASINGVLALITNF